MNVFLLCPFFCWCLYTDYTDNTNANVYYFWPYQEPPFDTLRVFLSAPACKDDKLKCTIKLIPCDVSCVRGVNCSTYENNFCSNREKLPLYLSSTIEIQNSNIEITSADTTFKQDIGFLPEQSNIYNTNPQTKCVLFQIEGANISFSNLNLNIYDPACKTPAFSVLVATPLVYKEGGTLTIKDVAWNVTTSLALFYNPEKTVQLNIETNNLSGNNSNYDIILLNVDAKINSANPEKIFIYGTLLDSIVSLPLISQTINIADFTLFECPPLIQYSSSHCQKRKAENIGLSVTLGVLIGLMTYIGIKYAIRHRNFPNVFANIPPKTSSANRNRCSDT